MVLGLGGFYYLRKRNTRQAVYILDHLQYVDNIIVENQECVEVERFVQTDESFDELRDIYGHLVKPIAFSERKLLKNPLVYRFLLEIEEETLATVEIYRVEEHEELIPTADLDTIEIREYGFTWEDSQYLMSVKEGKQFTLFSSTYKYVLRQLLENN